MQNRGVACKHVLALQIHRQATAALTTSTPDATPLATAQVAPRPSADRWAVTEAPSSCCVRLHIGEFELMYTMRDVTDAELTEPRAAPGALGSGFGRPGPGAARPARHAPPAARRGSSRPGRSATATPPVPPVSPPADMQALIQQAVQQALAAQQTASSDQPPAPSKAPDPTPPASQDGWCARHQVAMERRNNAKGTWWSHWLADENAGVAASRHAGRRVDARCPRQERVPAATSSEEPPRGGSGRWRQAAARRGSAGGQAHRTTPLAHRS